MVEMYRNFITWEYGLNYKLAPLMLGLLVGVIIFNVCVKLKNKRKAMELDKNLAIRKETIEKAKREGTGMFSRDRSEDTEVGE